MSGLDTLGAAPTLGAEAAAWVVRLAVQPVAEADWTAFRLWLSSERGARGAYDRALEVWLTPPEVVALPSPPAAGAFTPRRWALAASLALVAVIGAAATGPLLLRSATGSVLETRPGERRSFTLADGTQVRLGQDSKILVKLDLRRTVVMKRGDVSFQVADRALRPFRVVVGDDALTVLHTQFGVHRRDGRLRVVVRRGVVAVGPAQGDEGPRVRLTSGSVLDHVEGGQTFQVSKAGGDGFAWP